VGITTSPTTLDNKWFLQYKVITNKLVQKVVDLSYQGLSMRSIATDLDVSTTIVQKSLKMSIVAV